MGHNRRYHYDKDTEKAYREMRKQIEAERKLTAPDEPKPKRVYKPRKDKLVRKKHTGGFTHVITSRYEDAPVKYSILAGQIPKGYTIIFQCHIGEILPKFYWKLESYHDKYEDENTEPSKRVTRKRSIIRKGQL